MLGLLRDTADAAERVRSISAELGVLSRAEDGLTESVVVARAVQRAVAITRCELLHRARVELHLGVVPPIRGSERRLVQVLINLLVNAAHAITPGTPARHRVTISTASPSSGWISLEVRDTGCGIAPEQMPRIFEPFFTTKAPGCGTGLGLSICRRLMESMGGTIEVESELGHGTTVRLHLPGTAGVRM
jgi:signal transduction histidine kinase